MIIAFSKHISLTFKTFAQPYRLRQPHYSANHGGTFGRESKKTENQQKKGIFEVREKIYRTPVEVLGSHNYEHFFS
jgi:hypothetical protein